MTLLLHPLLIAATTATTTKSTTSGGSILSTLLPLALIGAAGYFLFLRPRKNRMKQQQTKAAQLEIGTEVMSVGGILGIIVDSDDTTFDVLVAEGVTMTFVKRAINARPGAEAATVAEATDVEDDLPADPWDDLPETPDYPETPDHDEHPEHPEHGEGAPEDQVDEGGQTPPGRRSGTEDDTEPGSEGSGSGGH